MDHRCLYGHRVPAAFSFAIQNRTCPTCGAATVTLNGYQAARKVTLEAGIDAVAAFQVIRVIETEWVIAAVPVESATSPPAHAPAVAPADTTAPPASSAAAASVGEPIPTEEEEVVVDDDAEPLSPTSVPEARIAVKPVLRGKAKTEAEKREPERKEPLKLAAFEPGEEDFFNKDN